MDQDPIIRALEHVKRQKCEIHLMQSFFLDTRDNVAKRLRELGTSPIPGGAHCAVKINMSWGDYDVEDDRGPGAPIQFQGGIGPNPGIYDMFELRRIQERKFKRTKFVHDKTILATWSDSGTQKHGRDRLA